MSTKLFGSKVGGGDIVEGHRPSHIDGPFNDHPHGFGKLSVNVNNRNLVAQREGILNLGSRGMM